MDKQVYEHIAKHNAAKGYGTSEQDVIKTIKESTVIWKDSGDKHRWYTTFTKVVLIDGMYIGFREPETHLENSDIPGIDVESIKQYEPRPEMVVVYYPME